MDDDFDEIEGDLDIDFEVDLTSIAQRLTSDTSFLAKLRANQLRRARTQPNIYGRYAQQQKPMQQTRKIT